MSELAIDVGAATASLPGEKTCGDHYLAVPFPGGLLVAAVDGLGHGEPAATAAEVAVATLKRHAGEPIASLVRRCHENLLTTRGVVMSVAMFNGGGRTMSWLGIGNVEGVLLRAEPKLEGGDVLLLRRNGVVGGRLPAIQPIELAIGPGDTLIFATDGIRSDFMRQVDRDADAQLTADRLLARCGKGTDDALVVVARCRDRRG